MLSPFCTFLRGRSVGSAGGVFPALPRNRHGRVAARRGRGRQMRHQCPRPTKAMASIRGTPVSRDSEWCAASVPTLRTPPEREISLSSSRCLSTEQLRRPGNIHRNPPCLIAREQPCFSALAGCTLFAAHTAKPSANVRKPAALPPSPQTMCIARRIIVGAVGHGVE